MLLLLRLMLLRWNNVLVSVYLYWLKLETHIKVVYVSDNVFVFSNIFCHSLDHRVEKESESTPVTTMDSGSNENPSTEELAAAVAMVFSTSLAEGICSGEAVSLNTSSTSIVVFPLGDGLKKTDCLHDSTI